MRALAKYCRICGEAGHYANNQTLHPLGVRAHASPLSHVCGVCGTEGHNARTCDNRSATFAYDEQDVAPPAPHTFHRRPLPHELAAMERRLAAREANPINPRGTLPTPLSTWVF